jgi:phosphoribosylamine--glycine ligase
MKKVLVVGSGAREHALASALKAEVIVAPGNAGTAAFARNAKVKADDIPGLVSLADDEKVDLVVVGPELPLTLGLVDALEEKGILVFGPSRAAARLEGSKAFMKRILAAGNVPTAAFEVFEDPDRADAYVRSRGPVVVKADGLCAGKGVVVASSTDEALEAVDRMMRKREFGDAGRVVVIEDILPGEEASFHFVCDGERTLPLLPAQDHKRVFDGDRGPNTGGMGAYAPAPVVTQEVADKVTRTIVEPTLRAMKDAGAPFKGVLFAGLMIERGEPRVLEFNVRFGDPETSVLVPTYGGDWLELLEAAARGDLRGIPPKPPRGAALAVVMAAEGYPGKPTTGDVIDGLGDLPAGVFVHHAGTETKDGAFVTAGGRILSVGACAETLDAAARLAYEQVDRIRWRGEHHRRDIGHRALSRSEAGSGPRRPT